MKPSPTAVALPEYYGRDTMTHVRAVLLLVSELGVASHATRKAGDCGASSTSFEGLEKSLWLRTRFSIPITSSCLHGSSVGAGCLLLQVWEH